MVKQLPFADIKVNAPGFGCMSLSSAWGPSDDTESLALLKRAVDIGCTFWDSAVVYGRGHNETLLGRFFKENPGTREKVFVASKCGLVPGKDRPLDALNSADHINEYIEGTISRLGSAPDLYYLHRIEPGRDLKESIGALNGLKQKGKCKYIGLSECNADTLRKACAIAQIDALQIEYSPWFTDHESNNLIATARELGVAIIAYSPLGKGVLTGTFTSPDQFAPNDLRKNTPRFQGENWDHNMKLVDEFKKLAEKRGCTPGQLALSWVMAQGAIPIPGTRKVERLEENFGATGIELSEEELKGVRKLIEEAKVTGARYPEAFLNMVGH